MFVFASRGENGKNPHLFIIKLNKRINKGSLFLGFPVLGILGFLIAGILGLGLVIAILRSGRL